MEDHIVTLDRPDGRSDRTRPPSILMRWSAAFIVVILALSGLLSPVDWRLEDAISHLHSKPTPDSLTIVGIDRPSLERLGDQAFDPLVRARVIRNLLQAGAVRIFVDFGMAQIGSAETAAEMARLLGGDLRDRVAFPVFSVTRHSTDGTSEVEGEPDPVLQALASIANVAVPVDSDGVVRRIFEGRNDEDALIASAPLWLAGLQPSEHREVRINYSQELDRIATLSFVDVLNRDFDATLVADKLIIIGATDLVLGDQLVVPRYSIIAGCELLALATLTLLADIALIELDHSIVVGLSLILTLLAVRMFGSWRPRQIAIVALAAVAMLFGIAILFQHAMLVLIQPTAAILGILIAGIVSALHRTGWMERRQAEADGIIQAQTSLIGRFLASSRDGIMTIAPDNRIVTANDAMIRFWGEDPSGLPINRVLADLPEHQLAEHLENGLLFETTLRPERTPEIPCEVAFNKTHRHRQSVAIAMLRDLRERKAHEQQLTTLATQDALTGLANRYRFEQVVVGVLEAAKCKREKFSVILIDMDQFKEINDTLGHSIGDALLIAVAERLSGFQEHFACAARLGGDEFAIICDEGFVVDSDDSLLSDLHDALTKSYRLFGMTLELGASIGVATYPDDAVDQEKLLQCADIAMYEAKRLGGGFQYYDRQTDQNSVRRLTLKGQLRQAIDDDQLVLYYQPKVCARTGKLVGSEALVRWIHPEHGFMPPDEFIPAAEQSGIIHPLTRWCIQRALRDKLTLAEGSRALPISINVSARVLSDPDIVANFIDELDSMGMHTSDLTLEITESALMTQVEKSLAVLNSFAAHGFKLSLDDFGAGYSSFDYLRRLPVHELKIDRAFLVARSKDRRAAEILKGMIDLGHSLELSVVCEGVETVEELHWLRANDCDIIQGYFTGKPMSIEQFSELPAIPVSTDSTALV